MESILLIVHLVLVLCLIGVVLLQRSEGGGLGIGGGGGVMSGRGAATALGKLTWALGTAFIATSIALTIIAAQNSAGSSVLDRIGVDSPDLLPPPAAPSLPEGSDLLPPPSVDAPLAPPPVE